MNLKALRVVDYTLLILNVRGRVQQYLVYLANI